MAAPKNPGGNAGKGRPRGSLNKATASIRKAAQQYSVEAIEALATVMRDLTAPHAARVSAANSILDRGHGKPTQPVSGDSQMPPIELSVEERQRRMRELFDQTFGLHSGVSGA